jgi:hypothetical protein
MKMKNNLVEKGFVIVMFVLVLVVFSFAQRDTEKLIEFYSAGTSAEVTAKENKLTAGYIISSGDKQ